MLYVFHGTDTGKVTDQAQKLVGGLLAKRPDAQVFTLEGSSYIEADLDALIGASGLFVAKHIVMLKGMFEVAESRESFAARLEEVAASDNIFVLTEGKLLAAHKRLVTQHATKIEEHAKTDKKKITFNVFALSDALMARDRRGLWTGYVEAMRVGIAPENIQGTLHWAVKTLLAARASATADEAGLKPVVFARAKRAAGGFSHAELIDLSRSLIEVYHEAHRGRYPLDVALERWCLR